MGEDAAFVAVLCRLGAARLCLAELVAKKAGAGAVQDPDPRKHGSFLQKQRTIL